MPFKSQTGLAPKIDGNAQQKQAPSAVVNGSSRGSLFLVYGQMADIDNIVCHGLDNLGSNSANNYRIRWWVALNTLGSRINNHERFSTKELTVCVSPDWKPIASNFHSTDEVSGCSAPNTRRRTSRTRSSSPRAPLRSP